MDNNSRENRQESYFVEDLLFHFNEWFKRLWIFILIFAVLGATALVAYTHMTYTPKYSASATFTVNVDVMESSSEHYNKATANQLAKTFPNILTSSSLNKIVCSDLGVDSISEKITASVLQDTNLFTITVTSTSPQRAYDVLNSVINNYPQVARFVIGSTQLYLIDTSSISTKPINYPDYTRKALLGIFAGAVIALVLMLMLSLMTNTVIRSSDITENFNVKCLGSVPELSKKKRSVENDTVPSIENKNINYKFREGIFTLRNNVIRVCKEKGYKSILVTSTISGEGKSVVAMNLAQAIAMKGYKTVLVDFDLRAPRIKTYMSIDNKLNSVSSYIKGEIPLNNMVYGTNSDNFFIALEENSNEDAIDLIGSEGAVKLIEKLKGIFEYVIIDTPPAAYLADSTVIGDYADAAVYVIAQDVVSRRNISDNLASFDNLNAAMLGAVLNRITKGAESLSYGKYYRKYGYGKYKYGYGKKHTNENAQSSSNGVVTSTLEDNGVTFDEN